MKALILKIENYLIIDIYGSFKNALMVSNAKNSLIGMLIGNEYTIEKLNLHIRNIQQFNKIEKTKKFHEFIFITCPDNNIYKAIRKIILLAHIGGIKMNVITKQSKRKISFLKDGDILQAFFEWAVKESMPKNSLFPLSKLKKEQSSQLVFFSRKITEKA